MLRVFGIRLEAAEQESYGQHHRTDPVTWCRAFGRSAGRVSRRAALAEDHYSHVTADRQVPECVVRIPVHFPRNCRKTRLRSFSCQTIPISPVHAKLYDRHHAVRPVYPTLVVRNGPQFTALCRCHIRSTWAIKFLFDLEFPGEPIIRVDHLDQTKNSAEVMVSLGVALVRIPAANADQMRTIADQVIESGEVAWPGSIDSTQAVRPTWRPVEIHWETKPRGRTLHRKSGCAPTGSTPRRNDRSCGSPRAVEAGPRSRIGITPRRIDHQAAARWIAVGRVIALPGDDFCSHEALGNGMIVW
jgi:hypothetical protein